ncbi:MAG TPA: energy transducer TonB [Nitrospirae bacterium]|nr:energy transducer TonB [Nitrospirota bacterium]
MAIPEINQMSLRKTVIFSVLFHIFAFGLLFAAGVSDRYGMVQTDRNIMSDKVLFVRLTDDTGKHGEGRSTVKSKLKAAVKIKAENKPVKVAEEERATVGKDEESEAVILSAAHEELADGVLLASYESEGAEALDFVSGVEVVTAVSTPGQFDGGKSGESKTGQGAGLLTAEALETIKSSIERAKTYPVLARKKGIEGTVYIGFRIGPRGEPENLRIIKSSGSSILDKATLAIVKRAAPFPNLDSPVEVPVVFRLTD